MFFKRRLSRDATTPSSTSPAGRERSPERSPAATRADRRLVPATLARVHDHSRIEKERKRRAVACPVLAGERTRITARWLGCSKRHVRRLAAELETPLLITEILRPYHATLNELMPRVITVVREALNAQKTDEADHFTRLRAVERYCELLELAQGKLPDTTNPKRDTLPQNSNDSFTARISIGYSPPRLCGLKKES